MQARTSFGLMGIITELTMRLASVEREPEKPFSARRLLVVMLHGPHLGCLADKRKAEPADVDALQGLGRGEGLWGCLLVRQPSMHQPARLACMGRFSQWAVLRCLVNTLADFLSGDCAVEMSYSYDPMDDLYGTAGSPALLKVTPPPSSLLPPPFSLLPPPSSWLCIVIQ